MKRPAQVKYIAPAVHAFVFLAMWALYAGSGRPLMNGPSGVPFAILLVADLPFSLFAFGIAFTSQAKAGLAFGVWAVVGTLWWYLLGRGIDASIRRIRRTSASNQPKSDH
ncbi:MAG: hypothetical protein ABSF70_07275 [Terracidiphilus sp.]|jgi:hypothetical protein